VGNGLGFFGLDTVVAPAPHVGFDLQVSLITGKTTAGTATGVGWAPSLQLYFNEPGRSTAYVGFGWIHASASTQYIHASVDGAAVNIGYEWNWQSGFGILLGGGVTMLASTTATDGFNTFSLGGGVHFNLELGLRFMFI